MSRNEMPLESLALHLRTLHLSAMQRHHEMLARQAEREGWSYGQYLLTLCQLETEERKSRRYERLLKQSKLPKEKTLSSLELSRLPVAVRRQVAALCEGDFVQRGENVLAFGLPGTGKTHTCCAVAHELIRRGYSVLFTSASLLVQRLLLARRELKLEQELKSLDSFDAVVVDDIGYIQQDRSEMEVLFTFLAERYERKSVVITSNLVFSQWDRIFKDPMTTASAIDRLVHHCTILEFTGPSFRTEAAKRRKAPTTPPEGEPSE